MNTRTFISCTFFTLLFVSSFAAKAQDGGQKISSKEIKVLIDSLGSALRKWYVYPDKAAVMTANLKKNYKSGVYNNTKDKGELGRQLLRDAQQVNKDGHLELAYMPGMAKDLEQPRTDTAGNRRAYEIGVRDARENNFAYKKAEVLSGNIGYIRWDGFYEFVSEALPIVNGAFQFLSNTKALIIDMRNNGGGSPEMVLQTQSYFFKEKTRMNDIIDRNGNVTERWADPANTSFKLDMPVYILTSHGTFSGAEDFTYGLKCAKRAIVVGDTTGGGAHPTRPFNIGQGFVVFIPTERSDNIATHTDWEGTGVWPDVVVPSDQALTKAQALIYADLLSKATDAHEKEVLRWNLACSENKARFKKQIKEGSVKLTKDELLKYCGKYNPGPGAPIPTIYIMLKGDNVFRHMDNGSEDLRLIPVSANEFAYDDDSGRSIGFDTNTQQDSFNMTITKQDGVFKLNKEIGH